MTTPRIEEIVEGFFEEQNNIWKSETGLSIPQCKEAEKKLLTNFLTQAYQAGRDEAVEIVKKHSYYAKFGYNTTAETIAVSPPKEKRICDTDDTIKALQDKK